MPVALCSNPTSQPSRQPTNQPSSQPTNSPSRQPSRQPTSQPSSQPFGVPTNQPSSQPTNSPSRQPSRQPTSQPSSQPFGVPTNQPSSQPTNSPSRQPSRQPTSQPSLQPFSSPTCQPSRQPTTQPSLQPYSSPTNQPSSQPSDAPSRQPSRQPTSQPSLQPFSSPTGQPSMQPSVQPTNQPSRQPTSQPSLQPNSSPTRQPSEQPSSQPSLQPFSSPTSQPSMQPTCQPSRQPSSQPSAQPTKQPYSPPSSLPSTQPSTHPSRQPTQQPSVRPSGQPTFQPSSVPSMPSGQPSSNPSNQPSRQPTRQPTSQPSSQPTRNPSVQPSKQPIGRPSSQPSRRPTMQPSRQPTRQPTGQPSSGPSRQPTDTPTTQPTEMPSSQPSMQPTRIPTIQPSGKPSMQPSRQPTCQPTNMPSRQPTGQPTRTPTTQPSRQPTSQPTTQPTRKPTVQPSSQPSRRPSMQPSRQPTRQPTGQPTQQPVSRPTGQPSMQPTGLPTSQPSKQPTDVPTCQPSVQPSSQPSFQPTGRPSTQPSSQPSRQPTRQPTGQPSRSPSMQPTQQPTTQPSMQPSRQPTSQPSIQPTNIPTVQPSRQPSQQPTTQPTRRPTTQPSRQPTSQPTSQPTRNPTVQPSSQPSRQPTMQPSRQPTAQPSTQPSSQPSNCPTVQPSMQPTRIPSSQPTIQPSTQPSAQPTNMPSVQPSTQPTAMPTRQPSGQPTSRPSRQPTGQPTRRPTSQPTMQPSQQPTMQPSRQPTSQPSATPTRQPTSQPTRNPSMQPSSQPSRQPTAQPTIQPTRQPSSQPSRQPSMQPTSSPSRQPTGQPTTQPSEQPTSQPSRVPTMQPSVVPSMQPSSQPTRSPTMQPSVQPSMQPSCQPSSQPTSQPSVQPSVQPSMQPTSQPSMQPTSQPSYQPSQQPTVQPTMIPSVQPSSQPSAQPTDIPSCQPTTQPTTQPTSRPSAQPSIQPSMQPTIHPTSQPSCQPTTQPSTQPSQMPSTQPSVQPTTQPTCQPTRIPTVQPTMQPSIQPTGAPSEQPSSQPTAIPSMQPTSQPSIAPTTQPSSQPSSQPSRQPSSQPSMQPSMQPSNQPSVQPSCSPTTQPSVQPTCQPSQVLTGRYVDILSVSNTPLTGTLSIPNAKYQLYIAVDLKNKEDTTVYCAAYSTLVAPYRPVSGDDVVNKNFRTLVSSTRPYVMITGLIPSTLYNVYCMTVSLTGNQMPYSVLLTHTVQASTLCCKVLTVDLSVPSIYPLATTFNMLAVRVDAAPSSTLSVSVTTNTTTSMNTLTSGGLFTPSLVTFGLTEVQNTQHFLAFTAGNTPGFYALNVTLSGTSMTEYEVVYSGLDSVHVLESFADPPVPFIRTAVFSTDGSTVLVSFSSPTNQGNVKNSFNCKQLFRFRNIGNTLCTWTDTTKVLLSFNAQTGGSQNGLLNVGSNITVLASNAVRALCTITNVTRCQHYHTLSAANVTVLAPTIAQLPVVVINVPPLISECNPLTFDLIASTGAAGRNWMSAEYHVLDSVDRVAAVVETFLNRNYSIFAPKNVIPASLFRSGHVYTFQVTLCNFLKACGSSSASVSVTSSSSLVPIVSILGPTSQSILPSAALTVTATAFTKSCAGAQLYNNLQYVWTIAVMITGGINMTKLQSTSSNPLVFKLPTYALRPSVNYAVTLKVTSTVSQLSSSVTSVVSVGSGPIVARLDKAGTVSQLNIGSYLKLDASASSDSNTMRLNSNSLKYSWSCVRITPTYDPSVCLLSFVKYNPSVNPYMSIVNITTVTNLNVSSINSTFRVTATVFDTTRSSSVYADVRITTTLHSSIALSTSSALASLSTEAGRIVNIINTKNPLNLVASLQLVSSCNAVWSVDDASINLKAASVVDTEKMLYVTDVFTKQTKIQTYSLLLKPNSLSQRSTLQFTLTCTNSNNAAVSTSITIVTNGAPLRGTFSVSPASGIEVSTSFLFSALYWSDPDLPLAYQMLYYLPNSASRTALEIVSKSPLSYGSSLLPAGRNIDQFNITCQLNVYDTYNAMESMKRVVKVLSNTNTAQRAVSMSNLLAATSSVSVDSSKQAVNIVATVLNTVDCSASPYCPALQRSSCLATANTCSGCLSGYVGDAGDHNTVCISNGDYYSLLASVAINSDTSNRSANSSVVLPKPTVCLKDSDCGSVWYKCNLLSGGTSVSTLGSTVKNNSCVVIPKTCNDNCNSQGSCYFHSVNTNVEVSECLATDSSCVASCRCNFGRFGKTCELSFAQFKALQCLRSQMVTSLRNITVLDDVNDNNVISWSSSLYAISQNPYQISGVDASIMQEIAERIVSNARSLQLSQYDDITGVLGSMDILSNLQTYADISCSSSSVPTKAVNNTPGESIIGIAKQFGALVGSQMVVGQNKSEYIYDNFRISVEVNSLSHTDSNNNIQVLSTSLVSPLTPYEVVTGVVPSSVTIVPISSTGTTTQSNSMITSLVETRSKVYGTAAAVRLISNAYHLSVSPQDTKVSTSILNLLDHITITIQNLDFQERYTKSYVSANFTTQCNGVTDLTNHSFLCVDSNTVLYHNCSGTVGIFTDYCPKPVPICNYLDMSSSSSIVSGLPQLKEVTSCEMTEYTQKATTCKCYISGKKTNRQLYGVFHNSVQSVANAFQSDGTTNIGASSTFVPYQANASFVEPPSEVVDEPQTVFGIVLLFSVLFFFVLLATIRTEQQRMVSVKKDKSAVSDKTTGRFNFRFGKAHKIAAPLPELLNYGKELTEGVVDTTTPTPEDFHRQLSGYIYSLLPSIYGNTRNELAGRKSLVQCMKEEFFKNHRYLSVFLTTEQSSADTTRYLVGLFRLLSIQCLTIFVVGILFTYQAMVDDDTCQTHYSQSSCYAQRSFLDSEETYCDWVPDPTAPFPATANYVCVYSAQVFTTRVMFTILIIAFAIVSILTIPLDRVLQIVFTNVPYPEEVHKIDPNGNRVHTELHTDSNSSKIRNFVRRASNAVRDMPRRGSVEDEPIPEDPPIELPTPVISRCVPESVEAARGPLVKLFSAFKAGSKDGDDSDEDHHQPKKDASVRFAEPSKSSGFQKSSLKAIEDGGMNATLDVTNIYSMMFIFDEIIDERNGFDHVETVKRQWIMRRQQSSKNNQITEGEEVDGFSTKLGGASVRMSQSGKVIANNAHTTQFDAQWGVEKRLLHDGQTEYALNNEVKEAITNDMRHMLEEADRIHNTMLNDTTDAHVGMNIIHLFISDLLRQHSVAGIIINNKLNSDYPTRILVSNEVRFVYTALFLLTLAFCCGYSVYFSYERTMYWQYHYVYIVIVLLFLELLVVSSMECLLFHVIIPNCVRAQWNVVALVLNKLIEKLAEVESDDVITPKKFLLNATSYLFVSNKIATMYPKLLESMLVLQYKRELPGNLCERWHYNDVGAKLIHLSPDGVDDPVVFRPPRVVPSRRRSVQLYRYIKTSIKTIVVATTNFISLWLCKLLRYSASEVPYHLQVICVRMLLASCVCGGALLWYFVAPRINIIAIVLLGLAAIFLICYVIIATKIYIKMFNQSYLRPLRRSSTFKIERKKKTQGAAVAVAFEKSGIDPIPEDVDNGVSLLALSSSGSSEVNSVEDDSHSSDMNNGIFGMQDNNSLLLDKDDEDEEARDHFGAEHKLSHFDQLPPIGSNPNSPKRVSFIQIAVRPGLESVNGLRKDALQLSDDDDEEEVEGETGIDQDAIASSYAAEQKIRTTSFISENHNLLPSAMSRVPEADDDLEEEDAEQIAELVASAPIAGFKSSFSALKPSRGSIMHSPSHAAQGLHNFPVANSNPHSPTSHMSSPLTSNYNSPAPMSVDNLLKLSQTTRQSMMLSPIKGFGQLTGGGSFQASQQAHTPLGSFQGSHLVGGGPSGSFDFSHLTAAGTQQSTTQPRFRSTLFPAHPEKPTDQPPATTKENEDQRSTSAGRSRMSIVQTSTGSGKNLTLQSGGRNTLLRVSSKARNSIMTPPGSADQQLQSDGDTSLSTDHRANTPSSRSSKRPQIATFDEEEEDEAKEMGDTF